jgi:glycosyltransferase involved in cell wall biosynthesis
VFFLGHRADIYELLLAADLFVLPSLHEGGAPPFAVMEAVSCKVPFIVSEATNSQETFVDGEDGIICAAKDIASLNESISWAVENLEVMRAMAENAHKKFLKHTESDMATQTLDLVQKM